MAAVAADWQGAHETETVEEGEILLSRRGRGASLLRWFVDLVCAGWLCVCVASVGLWRVIDFVCFVVLTWSGVECSGVEWSGVE